MVRKIPCVNLRACILGSSSEDTCHLKTYSTTHRWRNTSNEIAQQRTRRDILGAVALLLVHAGHTEGTPGRFNGKDKGPLFGGTLRVALRQTRGSDPTPGDCRRIVSLAAKLADRCGIEQLATLAGLQGALPAEQEIVEEDAFSELEDGVCAAAEASANNTPLMSEDEDEGELRGSRILPGPSTRFHSLGGSNQSNFGWCAEQRSGEFGGAFAGFNGGAVQRPSRCVNVINQPYATHRFPLN